MFVELSHNPLNKLCRDYQQLMCHPEILRKIIIIN
jgi:hypothetical protein